MEKTKVLLVEDDPNLGSLLKEYLEAKGYSTVLATNGKQGYDVFSLARRSFAKLIPNS